VRSFDSCDLLRRNDDKFFDIRRAPPQQSDRIARSHNGPVAVGVGPCFILLVRRCEKRTAKISTTVSRSNLRASSARARGQHGTGRWLVGLKFRRVHCSIKSRAFRLRANTTSLYANRRNDRGPFPWLRFILFRHIAVPISAAYTTVFSIGVLLPIARERAAPRPVDALRCRIGSRRAGFWRVACGSIFAEVKTGGPSARPVRAAGIGDRTVGYDGRSGKIFGTRVG